MNDAWYTIDGWFDFENVYLDTVNSLKDGARIVEVGTWLGRSTAFMAACIRNSQKNIRFFAIDTFKGTPNELSHIEFTKKLPDNSIYPLFLNNMKRTGNLDYVTPILMKSNEASKLFEDESLDFIFIDGGHTYEDVILDLKNWYPKVKQGCLFAGHDIVWEGVNKAIKEMFGNKYNQISDSSWGIFKEIIQTEKK